MSTMLNDYTISFFDLKFEGLKLRRNKPFPEAEFNRMLMRISPGASPGVLSYLTHRHLK